MYNLIPVTFLLNFLLTCATIKYTRCFAELLVLALFAVKTFVACQIYALIMEAPHENYSHAQLQRYEP